MFIFAVEIIINTKHNTTTIMKQFSYLLAAFVMMISFTGCKNGPDYLYVDTLSDEAKASFIESEDDTDAYNQAFNNYSTARFYPIFSEFEKTHRYLVENEDGAEACEGDDGEMAPPADNNEGGAVIYTDDDVTNIDGMGDEPTYEELSKYNTPNFVLYKLNDKKAREAAKDFAEKKISYEEFQKKTQDAVTVINLYDKNFDSCVSIDRKAFDTLLEKLRKTIAQIDKEAAAKKAEAAKE